MKIKVAQLKYLLKESIKELMVEDQEFKNIIKETVKTLMTETTSPVPLQEQSNLIKNENLEARTKEIAKILSRGKDNRASKIYENIFRIDRNPGARFLCRSRFQLRSHCDGK